MREPLHEGAVSSPGEDVESETAAVRKPSWLRVRPPVGEAVENVRNLMRGRSLHTVCEAALCPNISECWNRGTATFLILGNVCTRNCAFCAVRGGSPPKVNGREAHEVAEAVAAMKLVHAVITSVTRDDLRDGGAGLFASTLECIHHRAPGTTVEVLIPDFKGSRSALETVIKARPDILGHNIETVPRLYPSARPQADYRRSLDLLRAARESGTRSATKSGIMMGLGETHQEILQVMADLREARCDILTIGQYLRPSKKHLPVMRYYTPEEFAELKKEAYDAGFLWVESGPLVRSSYHADEQARNAGLSRSEGTPIVREFRRGKEG